jgi:SAM-dependent methyltransferase
MTTLDAAQERSDSNIESPYDFELFAHYYDLDQDDYVDDIALYLNLAQRCGSPIVEFGCGTGRLLVPMAEAGFSITGIDIAPAMLDIARQKVIEAGVQDQVTLLEDDIRSLDLPQRFRFGFCALNTLMHIPSLGDQLDTLRAARKHIQPGGLFAVDVLNPHTSVLPDDRTPLLLDKEMIDPRNGHVVLKLFAQRVDAASQIADITLIYDDLDTRGLVHRTLVPMQLRWLYPYEARLLMEIAGFKVDGIYGSYELEPFSARSEQLILIGRAP